MVMVDAMHGLLVLASVLRVVIMALSALMDFCEDLELANLKIYLL